MACTPYITRYAKLISTSEMPEGQKPRKAITAKEFKELGKCTYNFYIDMSNSINFSGTFGVAKLYPVRVADVYVLSLNGKSQIFSSSDKLYKFMVKHDIIADSTELKELFGNYQFVDPFTLAFHSKGKLQQLEILDLLIHENDIIEVRLPDKVSFYAYIPCLHEKDKAIVLAFLKTQSLTEETRKKLKDAGMKELDYGFSVPNGVIEELFEKLNI